MASRFDFSNKTVLVTGGTRGIGAAVVKGFYKAGAKLVITGTNQDKLSALKAVHEAEGMSGVQYMVADFLNPASLDNFLLNVSIIPHLDVCINNAGINRNNTITSMELADLDRILQVNLRAPILVCKAVCPVMKKNPGGGKIVNISSIWSLIAKEGRSVYGATKAGISSFSRHIAVDLAKDNILVNSVSPGFTRTELTESMLGKDEILALEAQVPLRRIADPSEMANVIMYLSSDLNTFITGQNIVVDGGFTIV